MRRITLSPSAIAALVAALLFGASTPIAKQLLRDVPPILLAGLLYLGSGIGLALTRMVRDREWRLPTMSGREWSGRENLCDHPEFTGYTRPGGFASHVIVRAAYCIRLRNDADAVANAPLLCAGLIGRVVCGGIHMSDIPSFPYRDLWEEREIVSVANLTREDARTFFAAKTTQGIKTITRRHPLDQANQALEDLREGRLSGAAVVVP